MQFYFVGFFILFSLQFLIHVNCCRYVFGCISNSTLPIQFIFSYFLLVLLFFISNFHIHFACGFSLFAFGWYFYIMQWSMFDCNWWKMTDMAFNSKMLRSRKLANWTITAIRRNMHCKATHISKQRKNRQSSESVAKI